MTPFFTRLKLAFKAFFTILFHDRIPDEVATAFGAPPPAAQPAHQPDSPDLTVDATATQLLAVLQRDGRLIDFLMEDIAPYADAQIGAAVRDVHAGCRQALERYLVLAPVLDVDEGEGVTIESGADAAMVKVIGNVAGRPPFRGVLRHRGWLVNRFELPPLPATARSVIAPAEVEVP
jgi:hypothetical protein